MGRCNVFIGFYSSSLVCVQPLSRPIKIRGSARSILNYMDDIVLVCLKLKLSNRIEGRKQ